VTNDGDPAQRPPPTGLLLWLPRSGFALRLLLVTAILVLAPAVGQIVLTVLMYTGCVIDCPEPPDHLDAIRHVGYATALLVQPFVVVRLYQALPPGSKRIRWTIIASVAGYCLWWLASRDLLGIML
jgi:uncharacterized BrkB/YihY/UPF0761 family membrane protein